MEKTTLMFWGIMIFIIVFFWIFFVIPEISSVSLNKKYSFVIASDLHYGQPQTPYDEYASNFVEKMNKLNPNLIFLNGDMLHFPNQSYSPLKNYLNNLSSPYYYIEGNHENYTEWIKHYPALPYSFDNNGIHFILLDLYCNNPEWLNEDLRNSINPSIIITHVDLHNLTRLAVPNKTFQDIVSNYSEKIMFVVYGHEHISICIKKNVMICWSGRLGSVSFYEDKSISEIGYRKFDVYPDGKIKTEYVMLK